MKRTALAAMLVCGLGAGMVFADAAKAVTTPEEHLGRAVGKDFELPDWKEVSSYYVKLAEQCPTVKTSVVGKTTEGRDFLLSVISSEANLKNLEKIKAYAKTIADPRGKSAAEKEEAQREGKVVLFMTPQIHSDESAGTQFAMQFAHQFATSSKEPWKTARENIVLVMPACLNPDGLDHVVGWYRKTVGGPYESSKLPELYQKYSGHDNNRDWFMFSLAESRIMGRLMYHEWYPQILWDVHQQGSGKERFFLPPYRDPMSPNLDAAVIAGINLIGTRAVLDMTREGFTGIATGSTYDMWYHGANRTAPIRHNMVGILTEAASCGLGSPIFQTREMLKPPVGEKYVPSAQHLKPWAGGWWRLGDIIRYEMAFGRSLLGTINREPRLWREQVMQAAQRAIEPQEGVQAWIIPADNRDVSAVRRMIDALDMGGAELHVSEAAIEADGRTYPAGSIVIRRDQPWGASVKDLFDVQKYPDTKPPYDIAGWTLPMLMGVRCVEVMGPMKSPLKQVAGVDEAVKGFAGDPRVKGTGALSTTDGASWTALAAALQAGKSHTFVTGGANAGLLVTESAGAAQGVVVNRMPRIGIYSPWSGSMDEGWLRWVMDTWKIPYKTVKNETIRAGKLGETFDVLVIADMPAKDIQEGRAEGSVPEQFAGGLGAQGASAVDDFVRAGGMVITFKAASRWAAELVQAPLVDVTASDEAKGFACPGSVLRTVRGEGVLTAGLAESVPVLFANGLGWREMNKAEREKAGIGEKKMQTLLTYSATDVLLSGYIAKPQVVQGQAAWVRVEHGKGRVHLFGFQPNQRTWTQGTFGLMFRAMFLDAGEGK